MFLATRELFSRVHWIVVVLAAIGAILAWMPSAEGVFPREKRHVLRMASLLFIFLVLAHVPFFAATRYALPVLPALYILSLAAVVMIVKGGLRRWRGRIEKLE